jgi:hypothetical protein
LMMAQQDQRWLLHPQTTMNQTGHGDERPQAGDGGVAGGVSDAAAAVRAVADANAEDVAWVQQQRRLPTTHSRSAFARGGDAGESPLCWMPLPLPLSTSTTNG